MISSVSGSVSCGTFTTGGGTITDVDDTGNGLIAGALTSLRVMCGTSPQGPYATVAGLLHFGSAEVLVNNYNATAGESTATTTGTHTLTVSGTATCGT